MYYLTLLNMKKLTYFGLVILTCLVVFNTKLTIKNNQLSAIALNNIETLSYAETSSSRCYGVGSVDCPDNTKTKIIL